MACSTMTHSAPVFCGQAIILQPRSDYRVYRTPSFINAPPLKSELRNKNSLGIFRTEVPSLNILSHRRSFVTNGNCDWNGCPEMKNGARKDAGNGGYNQISFSELLTPASWQDVEQFSMLAYLCHKAYKIPDIKGSELKIYYGLKFVTSSLKKKAGAAPMNPFFDRESTLVLMDTPGTEGAMEMEKQEAARDLQVLHSSPCERFICDDSKKHTRFFVIQGSKSLESWQTNLLFEPTNFEGTKVLVHRGIYKAAKGMYVQFLPEIIRHLDKHKELARFQFTGHSLGGSLSLLVSLMLLKRKVVKPSTLQPIVTFGSPFIFCGGENILAQIGLDEIRIHCVMIHRDIVPRAFSCDYPIHVANILKCVSSSFRSHPCLTEEKQLYSPLGKMFILQPDEALSPPHPMIPPGSALYSLKEFRHGSLKDAFWTFLNSPHPLKTLSNVKAYGSEGTILRDHGSRNYVKAMHGLLRQHNELIIQKGVQEERTALRKTLSLSVMSTWNREKKSKRRNWAVNVKIMIEA